MKRGPSLLGALAAAATCLAHPVARLRFGEGVLASHPQLAADPVSSRLLKLADAVARLYDAHLLSPLPILRQVDRAPLPGRDFLDLLGRLQRHVREHSAIKQLRGALARSVPRVQAP